MSGESESDRQFDLYVSKHGGEPVASPQTEEEARTMAGSPLPWIAIIGAVCLALFAAGQASS